VTKIRCAVCGGEAFRNKHGKVLGHTTFAMGGRRPNAKWWETALPYVPAEVCEGSDPGARP
jgi:hypothetical protein